MENPILSLLVLNVVLDFLLVGVLVFKKYYSGKTVNAERSTNGLILHFKNGIKAYRLEIYKDITIVYLDKPKDPTQDPDKTYYAYHFFWKGEIQFGEGTDLEELRSVVVAEIDKLLL